MEIITLKLQRSDPSTGNRYVTSKCFGVGIMYLSSKSVGEMTESAIEEMRRQLDEKEKEVRYHKPNLL
jgi:hypothetical protein